MAPYEIHNVRRDLMLEPLELDKSPGLQFYRLVLDESNLALGYLDTLYDEMLDEEPFFRFFALLSRCGVEQLKRELWGILNMEASLRRPEMKTAREALAQHYEWFCEQVEQLDTRLRIHYSEEDVFPLWLDSDEPSSYIASAKSYQIEWSDGALICLTDIDKRVRYGNFFNSYHQLNVTKLALPDKDQDIDSIHEMIQAWCESNREKIRYTMLDLNREKPFYYSPLTLRQLMRPLDQYFFDRKRYEKKVKYGRAEKFCRETIAKIFDQVECELMAADFELISTGDTQTAEDTAEALARHEEAKLQYAAARISAEFLLREYRKRLPQLDTLITQINPYGDKADLLGRANPLLEHSFSHALGTNFDNYVRFKEIPSEISPNVSVMEFGFVDGSGLEIAIDTDGDVRYIDAYDWVGSRDTGELFLQLEAYFSSQRFYPNRRDANGQTALGAFCLELFQRTQNLGVLG